MKATTPHYNIGKLFRTADRNLEFVLLDFNELQALGRRIEQDGIQDSHKHSFYLIGWIDHGAVPLLVDGQKYPLKAKDFFFICPGQVHENNFSDLAGVSGGAMMFAPAYFSMFQNDQKALLELTYIDNAFACPKLSLPADCFQLIRKTIDLIGIEFKNHASPHDLILLSLLTSLLLQLQRAIDRSFLLSIHSHTLTLYKQFKKLTEQHFREPMRVAENAAALHITPRHLHRVIKESSGKTPHEILNGRVILEAKKCLILTDKSVSQIAFELGFTDSSYFNKCLKKTVGITPTEFRSSRHVRKLP